MRVRTKSTAMAMLGMPTAAEGDDEAPPQDGAQPGESKAKKLLRGLFGH